MNDNELNALYTKGILTKALDSAIEAVRTLSIWKVVAVNPNQTVNIECCYLDWFRTVVGETTLASAAGEFFNYTAVDPGILVNVPYRVIRYGQFRDMVTPAVGDVGTYTPTYEDMRNWFSSGEKLPLASNIKMKPMHGAGIWEGYIQHNKDTQADYPVDNQTRIIKSNRITVTMSDPLDSEGRPAGQESITVQMSGISLSISSAGQIVVSAPTADIQLNCATATVNASSSVKIDTPATEMTGDLTVSGNVTISGTSTASDHISGTISGMSHTHQVTGAPAVIPGPPIPTGVPMP